MRKPMNANKINNSNTNDSLLTDNLRISKTIYNDRRTRLTNLFSDTLFININFDAFLDLAQQSNLPSNFKSELLYFWGDEFCEAQLETQTFGSLISASESKLFKFEINDENETNSIESFLECIKDLKPRYRRMAVNFLDIIDDHSDSQTTTRSRSKLNTQMQGVTKFVDLLQKIQNILNDKTISVCSTFNLMGLIRLQKDPFEIANIKKANEITSNAFTTLMKLNLIGKTEIDIKIFLESSFMQNGALEVAYPTIVAANERALDLHATPTNNKIKSGELIKIDSGAKFNNYCSDITRTIPSGKTFTTEQKKLYDIILCTQEFAISKCVPGNNFAEIDIATKEYLSQKIMEKFDISKNAADDIQNFYSAKNVFCFMPHKTSHWIGLDVHDSSPYLTDAGMPIKLQKNHCLTVEPGLYFSNPSRFIANFNVSPAQDTLFQKVCSQLLNEKKGGYGIRIEDNILITANGNENLTTAPKTIDEIEALKNSYQN